MYKIRAKIDLQTIQKIISQGQKISLSAEVKKKIIKCRKELEEKLSSPSVRNGDSAIYGINTGFGALHNTSIPESKLEKLQENLVMSHAWGTGEEVPQEIVKIMLLLKIQSLAMGYSGVSLQLVERLIEMFNHNILPVVYQQGSLGASGDLAPLAHLSLPLIGKGQVYYKGKKYHTAELFNSASGVWKNLKPLKFKPKEALALLNGTQFMSAYGVWILLKVKKLADCATIISAISLEAFNCKIEPFDELIHKVRPHKGQIAVAKKIKTILSGSEIVKQKKEFVQDPYSFRCIPQVHGASYDAINYAEKIFLTEINSVTDNPIIFPETGKILSGGNFHGQPLAIALDLLAIALAELGSISERRTYQLISGQRGLPPFLIANPGLNSGFMLAQYTAASIVSQNKQLCTPASVDSIVSSNGQEDHVSMGANAATKCFQVVNNIEKILAIELFTAAQALEFRRHLTPHPPPRWRGGEGEERIISSSPVIEKIISDYRKKVKFIKEDKVMYEEIEKTRMFLLTRLTKIHSRGVE
jgi:histidine ammonia-lyase